MGVWGVGVAGASNADVKSVQGTQAADFTAEKHRPLVPKTL